MVDLFSLNYAVASRPTVCRIADVLSNRQSVVPAGATINRTGPDPYRIVVVVLVHVFDVLYLARVWQH